APPSLRKGPGVALRSGAGELKNLVSQLKYDLKCYEELSPRIKKGRGFIHDYEDNVYVIERMKTVDAGHRGEYPVKDDSAPLTVQVDEDKILAARNGKVHAEIKARWNTETQSCEFEVNGKTVELWKISEMILSKFLFEETSEN
ncbi:MAG: hypothetical protein OXE82_15910, partial [Rhodobacter sp.]|nr:hypothetical protein [Rhodobacter sp.]